MTGPVKAFLLTELGDQIDCLFNPAELEMSKTNTWKGPEVQGKGAPNLAFQRGECRCYIPRHDLRQGGSTFN